MNSRSASSSSRGATDRSPKVSGACQRSQAWTQPQPLLVVAAIELSAADGLPSAASLAAAEGILAHLPANDEIPARLAAALIRLAVSRRTGDLDAVTAAAAHAGALLEEIPGSCSHGILRFARRC